MLRRKEDDMKRLVGFFAAMIAAVKRLVYSYAALIAVVLITFTMGILIHDRDSSNAALAQSKIEMALYHEALDNAANARTALVVRSMQDQTEKADLQADLARCEVNVAVSRSILKTNAEERDDLERRLGSSNLNLYALISLMGALAPKGSSFEITKPYLPYGPVIVTIGSDGVLRITSTPPHPDYPGRHSFGPMILDLTVDPANLGEVRER